MALAAAVLLMSLGVWVRAQSDPPVAQPPEAGVDTDGSAARVAPVTSGLPAAAERASVPELRALDAALTTLRQRGEPETGRPALEHAALALVSARAAERAAADGERDAREARDASLRARRIAYAALTLAQAQRAREQARVARDEAARERALAEGGLRVATAALSVARENARAGTDTDTTSPGAAPADNEARGDDGVETDEP